MCIAVARPVLPYVRSAPDLTGGYFRSTIGSIRILLARINAARYSETLCHNRTERQLATASEQYIVHSSYYSTRSSLSPITLFSDDFAVF